MTAMLLHHDLKLSHVLEERAFAQDVFIAFTRLSVFACCVHSSSSLAVSFITIPGHSLHEIRIPYFGGTLVKFDFVVIVLK